MADKSKIGLVLSGGGTRGIAHVGALKVLNRIGFEPDMVVGCSIGALIGAMYAAGRTPAEMEKFALGQKVLSLLQFSIGSQGLKKLSKMEKAMMGFIGVEKFEDLKIPLIINSTDLVHAREVVYEHGPIWPAIRASLSIPGFLEPLQQDGRVEVDGGVLDQHPFRLLPREIQKFILVDVSPRALVKSKKLSVLNILNSSIAVMQYEITRLRLEAISRRKYVIISPELPGHGLIEGEKKFKELIEHGAAATREMIPDIQRLLK
jgi:NTE family protein